MYKCFFVFVVVCRVTAKVTNAWNIFFSVKVSFGTTIESSTWIFYQNTKNRAKKEERKGEREREGVRKRKAAIEEKDK